MSLQRRSGSASNGSDGSGTAPRLPRRDWRVDIRALAWAIWRQSSPPPMARLTCSAHVQFDAAATTHFALVHKTLDGAGFDGSLALDAARSIATYVIDHMLVRSEASSSLGEIDFDAPFQTGLEELLDAIEVRRVGIALGAKVPT